MPELGKTNGETDALYFYVPMSRYILMSLATFGVYQFYWIYKNWEYLKNRDKMDIHPFWRGWFGIFFCNSLLNTIHDDALLKQYKPAEFQATVLAAVWIIAVIGTNLLTRLGIPFILDPLVLLLALMFLLAIQIWSFVPVQQYINDANGRLKPAARYYPWSAGHFILLGLSLALMMFSLGST